MSFTFIVPQIAIALYFEGPIAQRAVGDRYPFNHRIVMVKMDKIVRGKRSWVYLFKPN